jgi:hypothetical protein
LIKKLIVFYAGLLHSLSDAVDYFLTPFYAKNFYPLGLMDVVELQLPAGHLFAYLEHFIK